MSKAKLKKKIYSYGEGRKLELIFNEFIKVNILFVNGCTFVIEGRYITEDSALVDSKSVLEENFVEKKGYYRFTLNKEVYEYKGFEIELIYTGLWGYKVYSKNGNLLGNTIGGYTEERFALEDAENYIDKLDKRNKESCYKYRPDIAYKINCIKQDMEDEDILKSPYRTVLGDIADLLLELTKDVKGTKDKKPETLGGKNNEWKNY